MSWQAVWQRKGLSPGQSADRLTDLLRINGYDTGAGLMDTEIWRAYVARIQALLHITTATPVCEIGCGAGAFLYPLYRQGIPVTGLDYAAPSMLLCPRLVSGASDRVRIDLSAFCARNPRLWQCTLPV